MTADTAADHWSALLGTALLGTDRRPLPPPAGPPAYRAAAAELAGPDHATALLEQAALATVRRRAGLLPLPAPTGAPVPAAPDPRPELPQAAARRLTVLLAGRGGGGPANLAELLPQWLVEARSRGYRPPAALVPGLLEAARARNEVRADAVALAGPLGRWLAERNPQWRFVLRTTAAESPTEADRIWQEGLFAERVTHLTRLRRRDPAAGLALLTGSWARERAEDRLLFLDALQEGLSLADEPFLEAALDDRSKNVRATAAELLAGLPGSALGRRMARRALAAVELAADGSRLLVTPPGEVTARMRRDGVAPDSPTGRGEQAWRLGEVLAATPLDTWTGTFGLTPAQLLALPVADAADGGALWREELHEAWARAAVRQRDTGWARVLLGPAPRDGRPVRGAGAPAKLLAVLPPAERAGWTAAFLRGHGLGDAFQLLGACATPWTPPLSTAVVAALERAAASGAYPWSHSGVLGLTERSLAPATAPAVAALAADAAPDTAWAETFDRLARTLRFRAAMLAELAGPAAPG
ncbi:DUF5691 domain-containing protein [Kitasatospora sp. RB6PN24]|uniref:DUF5691 domain-containing protein n=1 Tax=Kitasatospora humi TaxID=2893891 RepID=UPI001E3FAFDD|nr:DUF5691 domain-containing protein [Kitasatospora humi]MCC9310536.1 DUF5691 domain-containing protein [Kitasatospora humi]